MKNIVIFFCLVFFYFLSFSQSKTPVIRVGDTLQIKLDDLVSSQPVSKNIRRLEVLDLRDDTGSLGYTTIAFKKIMRLTFDSATDHVLENWMRNYLKIDKGNVGDKLIVCLKKLRISNEVTLRVFENGHEGQPQNGWDEGIQIKMEFYLNKGECYYPLFRFDSLMNIDGKLPNDAPDFLIKGLTTAFAKLLRLNLESIPESARKLSLDDIVARNRKEATVPVLIETVYKKGVYKTFEEFKLNKPSITEFEFKKGHFGDMLYVKEGDKEFPDRTAWGFCDGKNLFINSSDIFSELIREGNTFYFKGVKAISRKAIHSGAKTSLFNLATNTGEKYTVYKVDKKYYQLDMETGEVY